MSHLNCSLRLLYGQNNTSIGNVYKTCSRTKVGANVIKSILRGSAQG